MLTRLAADNYRCLVAFELELPTLGLLAGKNGSGKTSVFDVLAAIQDLAWRGADTTQAFPADTVTAWQSDRAQRFELGIRRRGNNYTYGLVIERGPREEAFIAEEHILLGGRVLFEAKGGEVRLFGDKPLDVPRATIPFSRTRSFLAVLEPRPDNQHLIAVRDAIAAVWVLHVNPFGMTPTTRDEAGWLERDGSNFASWYRNVVLDRPGAIQWITHSLERVMPAFRGLEYTKGATKVRDLFARFQGRGKSYEVRFDRLSDGQRALVILYAVLAFVAPDPDAEEPDAALIAWDEPDNFVSLPEIQPWLRELSELAAERGVQSLVASHHPEVIDYLAADTALWFDRPSGGPARVRPLDVDRESGLRASEWVVRELAEDTGG